MSQQLLVYFSANGSWAEVPSDAPSMFLDADYGTCLPDSLDQIEEALASLHQPSLLSFVCDEEVFDEVEECIEELEEAEDEGDEAEVARLKQAIAAQVPHHEPAALSAVIQALIEHIQAHPALFDEPGEDPGPDPIRAPDGTVSEGPNGMTTSQTVLSELVAYQWVLKPAIQQSRQVFLAFG